MIGRDTRPCTQDDVLRPGLRALAVQTADALASAPRVCRIRLAGPVGSGRSTLLAAIGRHTRLATTTVDLTCLAGLGTPAAAVARAAFPRRGTLAWLTDRGGHRRGLDPGEVNAWTDPAPGLLLLDELDRLPAEEVGHVLLLIDSLRSMRPALHIIAQLHDAAAHAAAAALQIVPPHAWAKRLFATELRVPDVDPQDTAFLLKAVVQRDGLDLTAAARRSLLQAFEAPGTQATPRDLAQAAGELAAVRAAEAASAGPADTGDGDPLLAQWLAASTRFAGLRTVLRHRDDAWWRMLRLAADSAIEWPNDPQLHALLAQPGAAAWLRSFLPEARSPAHTRQWQPFMAALRATDDRLRRWGR